MRALQTIYIPQWLITLVGVFVVLAISSVGGIYVSRFGFDYEMVIMVLGLITGLVALAIGEQGIRVAILIWLLLFILGYRTMVISGAVIHPLTIIIFSLFILLILQVGILQRKTIRFNIPTSGWIFSIFWVWGFLLGLMNKPDWSDMVTHIGRMMTLVFNLSIMIPIFVVMSFVLQKQSYWKHSVTAMVTASTLIAVLGTLEWHVPAVKSLLPGFSADVGDVTADVLGFTRAPFAFWGHGSATFICNMMLPLILPLWVWHKNPLSRLIIILAAFVNLYAIYLTGWRSMWATTMLTLGVMTVLSRNWRAFILAIIAVSIMFSFAPPEAKARFNSFVMALRGEPSEQDSSSQKRLHRVAEAEHMIMVRPWGSGLTASGWPHNDVIQLAADCSILSVVFFASWYMITLFGIVRKYLRSPDPLLLSLLGSFLVLAAIFTTQPTIQHNQLMAPFWTIWALAYIKLREPIMEEENINGQSETYGSDPDLQLRGASTRLS